MTIEKQTYSTGCIVCGENLQHHDKDAKVICHFCGREDASDVACSSGHFVCDACHREDAVGLIHSFCLLTGMTDPVAIAMHLMDSHRLKMHGPEHYFLVPAVLITAYYNLKGDKNGKAVALLKAKKRAEKVPGGFCGSHGNCGAAVGTGIFVSVITGATPLTDREWKASNMITARCLGKIANAGGPRCCKRNSRIAIDTAIDFVSRHLEIEFKQTESSCRHSGMNAECLFSECGFYPENYGSN